MERSLSLEQVQRKESLCSAERVEHLLLTPIDLESAMSIVMALETMILKLLCQVFRPQGMKRCFAVWGWK